MWASLFNIIGKTSIAIMMDNGVDENSLILIFSIQEYNTFVATCCMIEINCWIYVIIARWGAYGRWRFLELWWFEFIHVDLPKFLLCLVFFLLPMQSLFGMTTKTRGLRHCLNWPLHISLEIAICFCLSIRTKMLGTM